jgi:hypothetical protein
MEQVPCRLNAGDMANTLDLIVALPFLGKATNISENIP